MITRSDDNTIWNVLPKVAFIEKMMEVTYEEEGRPVLSYYRSKTDPRTHTKFGALIDSLHL